LFSEEGYPMIQKILPALRGVSRVEEVDVVGMLHEMMDHLVGDFAFKQVQLAGEGHINRTTEPVLRFLIWLERTPEAQVALRLAFRRLKAGTVPELASQGRGDGDVDYGEGCSNAPCVNITAW
jgi:hypothetical protein